MAAQLSFDVTARDTTASRTFAKVANAVRGLDKTVDKTGRRTSRTFSGMSKAARGFGRVLGKAAKAGAVGVAILGGATLAAAPSVLSMASNIELMGRKAATVFGNQIGRVKTWARANAEAMGLTSTEATGLAANFGDLLIPMGFARKEAASMSTKVIGLSGALAEWSGGTRTATEVSEILASALLGEREALKGLGISISEADVAARLAAKGQEGLTGAALEQAEAIATQELIMEKSTDAQDAYAKGSGFLARKLASAKAGFKTFGETLLVAVTPALKTLAGWFSNTVMPALQRFADWFKGPGKFIVGAWFVGVAEGAVGFAKFIHGVFDTMQRIFFDFGTAILEGASIVAFALGNRGLGASLLNAGKSFRTFGDKVAGTMDAAGAALGGWELDLNNTKKELKLKADISNLNRNLRSARRQLKDKNLTKTRRAELRARIDRLLRDKRRAQNAINSLHGKTVTTTFVSKFVTDTSGSMFLRGGGIPGLPPGFAHGTRSAPRGFALVGEEGPELVRFRGGEQVIPSDESARMMLGGVASPQRVVVEFDFRGDADLVKFFRKAINARGGSVQKVLGN